MADIYVKAVKYVPTVTVDVVIAAVKDHLARLDISCSTSEGFERRGYKAWDTVELDCNGGKLLWRGDRPRNFTVKPRYGRGRSFRIRKDDTVNVGRITEILFMQGLDVETKANNGE